MATSPTVPPKDEIRHVVIEPPKPLQERPKQYVTLTPIEVENEKYKANEAVWLSETTALPFIAAHRLIPLDVAIREGIYPPQTEKPSHKIADTVKAVVEDVTGIDVTPETPAEEVTQTPEETSSSTESQAVDNKSFLGNSLRDAIQAQKAKIDAAKLAAIRSGGKK